MSQAYISNRYVEYCSIFSDGHDPDRDRDLDRDRRSFENYRIK